MSNYRTGTLQLVNTCQTIHCNQQMREQITTITLSPCTPAHAGNSTGTSPAAAATGMNARPRKSSERAAAVLPAQPVWRTGTAAGTGRGAGEHAFVRNVPSATNRKVRIGRSSKPPRKTTWHNSSAFGHFPDISVREKPVLSRGSCHGFVKTRDSLPHAGQDPMNRLNPFCAYTLFRNHDGRRTTAK